MLNTSRPKVNQIARSNRRDVNSFKIGQSSARWSVIHWHECHCRNSSMASSPIRHINFSANSFKLVCYPVALHWHWGWLCACNAANAAAAHL